MAIVKANSSKSFSARHAVKSGKQLLTTSADLYGGATDPVFGAGNEVIFMEPLKIEDAPEFLDDEGVNGTQVIRGKELVAVPVKVSGKARLHTLGCEELIYAGLGYETINGPGTGGTHLFLLDTTGKDQRAYTTAEAALVTSGYDASDRLNRYLHIGQYLGPGLVRASNVSIKELTIAGTAKDSVTIEFSGSAERVERDPAKPGLSTLSLQSNSFLEWFMLRHCTANIGIVGSLETIQIVSFTAKNVFGQAEGNYPTGTSNSGLSQAEPVSDGFTKTTLELEYYRHDTDTFKTWEQAKQEIACSLEFTRDTKKAALCFPRLVVTSAVPEITKAGTIKISCDALLPTGTDPFTDIRSMSGTEQTLPFATPMYMVMKNGETVNYGRNV